MRLRCRCSHPARLHGPYQGSEDFPGTGCALCHSCRRYRGSPIGTIAAALRHITHPDIQEEK